MAVGAAGGLLAWLVCFFTLRNAPPAAAFYLTSFAFVAGCGALPLIPLERRTPLAARIPLAGAVGTIVAPLAVFLLAKVHLAQLFPTFAFAATGVAVARWSRRRDGAIVSRGDLRVALGLALVAFAIAAWVSSGRIVADRSHISLYGDYDTFDLTYYAAIASELAHTVPPASPFYAGHQIVYSYFPLLLLAAIHDFSGVRTIQACVAFGWPFFAGVTAAMSFALFRVLGSRPFAAVSTVLLFTGSGLAYVAAWLWPETKQLDPVVLSSMFMAPSAEWLYFNTWTPALGVIFAALYAWTRIPDDDGRGWPVLSGVSLGLLFMVKSFAFGVVLPAVAIAALIALWQRRASAGRLIAVPVIATVVAAPWLLAVITVNNAEGRAGFSIRWLSLVRRMLLKTGFTDPIVAFVGHFVSDDPNRVVFLTIATLIFLVGGLGTRCLGLMTMGRAATGREALAAWTPLAWVAILGIAIPFALDVAPFPNSIQAYQLALFVLWPFTAYAVWPAAATPSVKRWIATAALLVVSAPATAHYAWTAHSAAAGAPLTTLDAGDLAIVRYLRKTDLATTMLLHRFPLWPSLYAIESERHVVLAWSSYVAGDGDAEVEALDAEINAFFGSATAVGADDLDLLRRFHVTHVIVRSSLDRLHPHVLEHLRLVTGTPDVRLYEVSAGLSN